MSTEDSGEHRPATRQSFLTRFIAKRPRLSRAIFAIATVLILFLILWVARVVGAIDPQLWSLLENPLLSGARNTIQFSLTIIPVGLLIGFTIGWARFSRHPMISWPATVYVDFVRGLPPLVMILFSFFWLPLVIGNMETGLSFAVLALAIHTSAYQAEIFRAGFQSVARGQIEAGQAIGLSNPQIMANVILPQTFRVTLPALGNEFALVIKDSSLLAIVGAMDLVYWGRQIEQFTFSRGVIEWVMIIWIIVALFYFVITYLVTQTVGAIEHSFRVPGLGSVAF